MTAHPYARLMRIDRPIGSFLLMWPTLTALWMAAQGLPRWDILLIFIVGVFVMRAAGCVINDIADRNLDGAVERTRTRPLASGEVSLKAAIMLFVGLAFIAFNLVLLLNDLTFALSFVGVVLTVIYPFCKRFLPAPQMVLGTVWSWSIVMAYSAVNGEVTVTTWWLFAANWCLTMSYDTMYAMVDRKDDLTIGVKSSAIWFGRWDRHWIGLFQLLFVVALIGAGLQEQLGLSYWFALVLASSTLIYQQKLINKRHEPDCFKAFLNNHYTTLIMLLGTIAALH